jgi:hypothetical protein
MPAGISSLFNTSPVTESTLRNSLSSASNVPCQSSPSTQVTKFAEAIDRMPLGHPINDVGEIGFRIEPVELGGLQHGIEHRGALTAGLGTEEQKILSRHGNTAQRSLRRVVVDADAAVTGTESERISTRQRIL